jgi:PST family polysaccharide transporter
MADKDPTVFGDVGAAFGPEGAGVPIAARQHTDSLASTTSTGFLWAMFFTVGSKLVATVGQFGLALLLTKEDFGWVALALAIAAFPTMLHAGGVSSVLVQRQARFHLYASACFWMGLALALLAALFILIAAAVAGGVTHSSTLAWLLVVASLNTAIAGLGIVPQAMLQMQLRFKTVAMVNATNTVLQMLAAVPLAWMGLGPFSVILATTFATTGSLVYCWSATRPPIRFSPGIRRWRYLISDTSTLLTTNMIWTVVGQGDRLILGWFAGKAQVGVYYFANNLSMQISSLLMTNLSGVLFPTFSRLAGDPIRQTRAFMRAARVMSLVGVPATLLQAALADPGLRLLFGEKWAEAIPAMQWFCVGMAGYVVGGAVTSLLMAQRRFKLLLWIAVIYLPVFMVAFVLGAWLWGATGGAAVVCCCYWIAAVAGLAAAIRPSGGTLREVLGVYGFPVLASAGALVPGLALARLVPDAPWLHFTRASIIGGCMVLIYPALAWARGGPAVHDVHGLVRELIRRVRRAWPSQARG